MGTKNPKNSVSVERVNNRIRLRWRYQKRRFSINLYEFFPVNLVAARKIAADIEREISLGTVDLTCEKYKPEFLKRSIEKRPQLSMIDHFVSWVREYRNMDCDRDIDYFSTRNMMRKWTDLSIEHILTNLNQENIGASTYNRRLTILKRFFSWGTKRQIFEVNPLDDVLPKKNRRQVKESRTPFSTNEIARILSAFKEDAFSSKSSGVKHSHYYPFVYFLFKTGVRNSEAVGLRVKNLDPIKGVITIEEALTRSLKGSNSSMRVRKGTKNAKTRKLPYTCDLKSVLSSLTVNKGPDELVFLSPRGKAIDDMKFQARIFRNVLDKLGIKRKVLYACRHTFASRCLAEGLTPVTTAFLMGNSPQTTLRHYAHLVDQMMVLPKIEV